MEEVNSDGGIQISESKRRYVVEVLAPTIQDMIAECIYKMPEDVPAFMLQCLEQRKAFEEDKLISAEEKQRLITENSQLEKDIQQASNTLQATMSLGAAKGKAPAQEKDETSDFGDSDEDEEPPPGWDNPMRQNARCSVSAEAYGDANPKKQFVAPFTMKTDVQKGRLKTVLTASFLFSSLDEKELSIIIGAMKEVEVEVGERIIQQGEQGDFLFVIESGDFECTIADVVTGAENVVRTCQRGDVFGELALLYNCPRAASVLAKSDSVCWQLDRETFNHVVKEAAVKTRERYDAVLAKVPILAQMGKVERSQISDALHKEKYVDGATIMSQGEVGNKFYIIEEGECVALKNGKAVMSYGPGGYFGELALISDNPRAATVIAKGAVELLWLDSAAFRRLLDVSEIYKRAQSIYQ